MTSIEQQIQQINALAMQHYRRPSEEAQRNAWLVTALTERLRDLAVRVEHLEALASRGD